VKRQLQVGALALVVSAQAWAGDFIDTRIAFAFADDNVLANSGETRVNSPTAGFGAGAQNNQFYDNFNTRFSGFETLSNLTLYKKAPAFFEGFEGEAAVSVLLLELSSGSVRLVDNSSYIKLNYRPPGWGPKEQVSLTGMPVSSDRFRLGYAWRISWGGDSIFTYGQGAGLQGSGTGRPSAVPGMKLQVTRDRWYAFAGAKTGLLNNQLIREQERAYAGLVGGGFDIVPGTARIEANGGYFQRGLIPRLADQGIRAPVNGFGGSAQVSIFSGDAIQPSVDMRMYKNDPDALTRFFKPETYPGGFSYQVALEGSYLGQSLQDPDVFAKTVLQSASAAALQVRLKYNFWRFNVLALYRSLSFIQFDVPGLIPYTDYPKGSELSPETFVAAGADYNFSALHLTTGLILGVQNPAAQRSPATFLGGNQPPAGLTGRRTVVVRDVNVFDVLPADSEVIPVFSVKGTFRMDISEYLAAVGEVFYNRDANRVTFRDSAAGVATPVFENENQVGFNLVLQSRF
jgi:hypothetical protein